MNFICRVTIEWHNVKSNAFIRNIDIPSSNVFIGDAEKRGEVERGISVERKGLHGNNVFYFAFRGGAKGEIILL